MNDKIELRKITKNSNSSNNSTTIMNENENSKKNSGLKSDLRQLFLLVWKNYSLQKRSIIGSIVEILVPALFAIILQLFKIG